MGITTSTTPLDPYMFNKKSLLKGRGLENMYFDDASFGKLPVN